MPAGRATTSAATDQVEVCDLAGNCTTAGPYTDLVIDRSPPSVTCTPDDGKAVDAWRGAPFTFTCEISDEGSGLVTGTPATVPLLATLPDGEASAAVTAISQGVTEVCDAAGSCVPVGPIEGLQIDRQAPTVHCAPAGDGWSRVSSTVSCSVDDAAGSGLEGAATVTLRATAPSGQEGTFTTGTAEVCDLVGNCTTAGPVTDLRVDHRAPSITCDTPAERYGVEARIPCRATDGGSGLASADDAGFVLVTSVGDGNRNAAARTSAREVCDVAGNCATAGPLTVSVDLTGPRGEGPALQLPRRVTVLSTYAPLGPTAVPYSLPDAPGSLAMSCRARPGTVFGLGWSTVACEAIDAQGSSAGSFPLVLKALPTLAPTEDAAPGGAWRAVGVGFAPNRAVVVEIAGQAVATGTAGPDGRVSIDLTIPAHLPSGDHQLVVRGDDGRGDPHLVVSPLTLITPGPGIAPPGDVPPGAPALPVTGPDTPPDPGPAPFAPDLGDIAPNTAVPSDPTAPTPTIDLPGGGPGAPGGPTTTQPGGGPGGPGDGDDGGGFPFTRLPRTGADVLAWLGLGLLLTAAGVLLVRARRGPRPTTGSTPGGNA